MPARSELKLDRRTLLGSTAATLGSLGLPNNLFAEANFQQEQKEKGSSHLILGQAVTVDQQGRVTLSNFASGAKQEFRLPVQDIPARVVNISPNGEQFAIWAHRNGQQHWFIGDLINPGSRVDEYRQMGLASTATIRWSPDSRFVSISSGTFQSTQLVLFNLENKKPVWLEARNPSAGSFSPNGRWFTYSPREGRVILDLNERDLDKGLFQIGRGPSQFSIDVWSADSQILAFIYNDNLLVLTPETRQARAIGEAAHALAFSPDSRLLVYLESSAPPRLAIFDSTTGQKVTTPNLRDVYSTGEIAFLDNETFRLVADDPTTDQIRTAVVAARTGEIIDSKVISSPASFSLFTRYSTNQPDRFPNPNWVAGYDVKDQPGLWVVSLETGQSTKLLTRNREGEYYSQVFVAEDDQILTSENSTYFLAGGKRHEISEEATSFLDSQTAESQYIPAHLISSLPEGEKINFIAGEIVSADSRSWWYLNNKQRYYIRDLAVFRRNVRYPPKQHNIPESVLGRIAEGVDKYHGQAHFTDWDGRARELQPDGGRMIIFIAGYESDPESSLLAFVHIRIRLIQEGWRPTQFLEATYNVEVDPRTKQIVPVPYSPEDTGRYPPANISRISLLLKYYSEILPRTKFILIGHSLGGFMALNAAIRHPELIDTVVTIASPIKGIDDSVLQERCELIFPDPLLISACKEAGELRSLVYWLGEEPGIFLMEKGKDPSYSHEVEEAIKNLRRRGAKVFTFVSVNDSLIVPLYGLADFADTSLEGKEVKRIWHLGIYPRLPETDDLGTMLKEIYTRHWELLRDDAVINQIARVLPVG